jgi:cellobiose phosphorylase
VPADWTGYTIDYRFRETTYRIEIELGEPASISLDGHAVSGDAIPLADDGRPHAVQVRCASVSRATAGRKAELAGAK